MPPVKKGVYGLRGDRAAEYTPHKAAYMKQWRADNREKVREYNRKSYTNRRLNWKRCLKIGDELYNATFEKQEGKCAICRKEFGGITPHIDHDHKTGIFRGLLCSSCNTGIGKFGDDPNRLEAAARYCSSK